MPKREKMTIEHRAKQFLPFTALTELEVAIRKKNREYCQKLESKSLRKKVNDLKNIIGNLERNEIIWITYNGLEENSYIGEFKSFDLKTKILTIGNKKIPIDSIYELRAYNKN